MPQTISIQRGSTTITNGQIGTLFTNGSGGFGTRVIVNQLAFTGNNNGSGNARNTGGTLIINGSGVGRTPIGVAASGGSTQTFLSPFFGTGMSPFVNTVNSSIFGGAPMLQLNAPAQYPTSVPGSASAVASCMVQTFWIGPSDVVQAGPFGFTTFVGGKTGNVNSSVTVLYSFTLITES